MIWRPTWIIYPDPVVNRTKNKDDNSHFSGGMLHFSGGRKTYIYFYVIPPHWHDTDSYNPSSSKTRQCIINAMHAGVLCDARSQGISSHGIYTVEPNQLCLHTLRVNNRWPQSICNQPIYCCREMHDQLIGVYLTCHIRSHKIDTNLFIFIIVFSVCIRTYSPLFSITSSCFDIEPSYAQSSFTALKQHFH